MTESSRSKTLEAMARELPYVAIPLKVTEGGKVTTNGTTVGELLNTGLGAGPFGFLLVEQVCQAIAEAALTAYESHLQAEGMSVVPGWRFVNEAPETKVGHPIPVLVFGERLGVYFGHLHRLRNCSPVINVAHLNGDAVSDWGVTHFMLLPDSPASPFRETRGEGEGR